MKKASIELSMKEFQLLLDILQSDISYSPIDDNKWDKEKLISNIIYNKIVKFTNGGE